MRDGEHRHLPQQRPDPRTEQKQAEHEQDVVESVRDDVVEPGPDVFAQHLERAGRAKHLLQREGIAAAVVPDPLPRRPVPLLIGLVDLAHAHGVVAERRRVVPGETARLGRDVAFEHDQRYPRDLGVAGYRDIHLGDARRGALAVESQFDGIQHARLERLEGLRQLFRLQCPQPVVLVRVRRLGGVLVLRVDAGQQRLDAGAQFDPVVAAGEHAHLDQRRFDDICREQRRHHRQRQCQQKS